MLTISGLVAKAIPVPPALPDLDRIEHVEDFVCLEGWMHPGEAWSGYRLRDLLHLASPLPEAHYVEIASGDFVAVLPLDVIERQDVLLADTRNGSPLTETTGGPWRLVVPGGVCYQSVKNVDRITLVPDNHRKTAQRIALSRIRG